jgi:hypothetical protein
MYDVALGNRLNVGGTILLRHAYIHSNKRITDGQVSPKSLLSQTNNLDFGKVYMGKIYSKICRKNFAFVYIDLLHIPLYAKLDSQISKKLLQRMTFKK